MPNTPNLDLEKPSTGDYEDAWGPVVNSNWDKVDAHASAANHATAISGAVTTHEAASNPHPTYLTAAEGDADYVELAGDTMTGELTVPSLAVDGITGATTNSRYVGATASGPPASGTFSVGDFTIDLTGQMHVCTVAGSPGTWVSVGSGQSLGLAGATANFDVAAVGVTMTDVTGLSITVQPTSRSFVLHAFLMVNFNSGTAAANAGLQVLASITDNSNNQLAYGADTHYAITTTASIRRGVIDVWSDLQAPIAVATTYKCRARTGAAVPANWGSATFQGGWGLSPAKPYFIEAIGR